MNKYIDITGQKFNRFKVVSLAYIDKNDDYKVYWNCICDCGNKVIRRGKEVRSGIIKSCGCYQRELMRARKGKLSPRYVHGKAHTKIWNTYRNLKKRCEDKNDANYFRYGGRGIKNLWPNFIEFYKDMGDPPTLNHTIDRIDNDGNYCKENCRWATKKEQAINRRTTKFTTFNGQTLNQREWAKKMNISYKTLNNRFMQGWSVKKALTQPLRKMANNVQFVER